MTEETKTSTEINLSSVDKKSPHRQIPVWIMYLGLILCALFAVEVPVVSGVLFGTLLRTCADCYGSKSFSRAAIFLLIAAVVRGCISLPTGIAVLTTTLTAFGIVKLMWVHEADTTHVAGLIVFMTCLSLGFDLIYTSVLGTTIPDLLLSSVQQMLPGEVQYASMEENSMSMQLVSIFKIIWPLSYVVSTISNATYAALGSCIAGYIDHTARPLQGFTTYDAPLWSVGVLATAVLCIALGNVPSNLSQAFLTVGSTVAMSVRLIFTLQGFAVVSSKLLRKVGCLSRAIIIFFAVWAEMMFMVVSIIGLIDIWANFRKLERSK